ncbi:hypothetical protein [Pseudomonas phage pPA-3099-2aT.2]|uniref:Uncharacterized protein n=1 Tax=Pseudomonas phage pPA-3099-2aT.2 TaxID=3003808 RepID=A0AAE9W7P1_9CAUD|nr:hypothetical protein QE325_gp186 [Pseudomonas phage pPA-3099-2aT.2]WBQ35195.1 hypothetical protein [Pseudomonas phage pPA-3099-2aT.2]
MRDEFEAWWRSAEVLKSKRAVAFDAWQASRAALMVELPEKNGAHKKHLRQPDNRQLQRSA